MKPKKSLAEIYKNIFELKINTKSAWATIKCEPKDKEKIKKVALLAREILDLQDGKFIWGNDTCFLNHKEIAIISQIGDSFVGNLVAQTNLYKSDNLADLQNTLIDAYLEYLFTELKLVLLNFKKS